VPAEERSGKTAERCRLHPTTHVVATCDGCGRALCLTCAIPVRGRTFGAECLATVLGPEVPVPEEGPSRPPGITARIVARWALALALVGTMLPWSRAGVGAGAFGAWTDPPRWSSLAAVAAVAGLLLSIARGFASSPGRGWDVGTAVAGALTILGTGLAARQPPDFSGPWLGPWITLVAAAAAILALLSALWWEREPTGVRI
jgi:hypothetical protein